MNTTQLHIPSNRVRDIERYFHTELAEYYPDPEIGSFSDILFEHFLGWDKAHLLLHRNDTINQSDLLKFHWAIEDLKQYRPIQYITGHTSFCDLDILVAPGVLIPRPETEEIVSHILPPDSQRPAILDLCTGSGCIAIALKARYPEAQVFGIDISEQALTIARQNATHNGLLVNFLQCDILHDTPPLPVTHFDIIVSNPPYIRQSEKTMMRHNVLDHEPHLALFVPDDDPLRFYRAIAEYALQHLTAHGQLIFEINEHLGEATCQLLHQLGFTTSLQKDFFEKDRSIIATIR